VTAGTKDPAAETRPLATEPELSLDHRAELEKAEIERGGTAGAVCPGFRLETREVKVGIRVANEAGPYVTVTPDLPQRGIKIKNCERQVTNTELTII